MAKVQGKFRQVVIQQANANNEIEDVYYMIPEHDDDAENTEQLKKKILITMGKLRLGEE